MILHGPKSTKFRTQTLEISDLLFDDPPLFAHHLDYMAARLIRVVGHPIARGHFTGTLCAFSSEQTLGIPPFFVAEVSFPPLPPASLPFPGRMLSPLVMTRKPAECRGFPPPLQPEMSQKDSAGAEIRRLLPYRLSSRSSDYLMVMVGALQSASRFRITIAPPVSLPFPGRMLSPPVNARKSAEQRGLARPAKQRCAWKRCYRTGIAEGSDPHLDRAQKPSRAAGVHAMACRARLIAINAIPCPGS